MSLEIVPIDRNKDYKRWCNLYKKADGATLFHHPDFLSYHQDRFNEEHLGVFKGAELIALIVLAIENKEAKSPYGASYGGFIGIKNFSYSESKEIVTLFLDYLQQKDIKSITITPPFSIYYKNYSQTLLFAMLEQGFYRSNSDISSVVALQKETLFNAKLNNIAKKAKSLGVETLFRANLDDFWSLMEQTFSKHKKSPTHTKSEYAYLMQQFPKHIYCNIAYLDKKPLAGVGVFELNEQVMMSFYLCSNEAYKTTQALTLLLQETIKDAKQRGFSYFDFGTSSVGMQAKPNIFKFKEGFGAIGLFRDTFTYKG